MKKTQQSNLGNKKDFASYQLNEVLLSEPNVKETNNEQL